MAEFDFILCTWLRMVQTLVLRLFAILVLEGGIVINLFPGQRLRVPKESKSTKLAVMEY
jgi:hypothetical protein